MNRDLILDGIQTLGPCTTVELTRHLCGESPSPTESMNIRKKLYRMVKQNTIHRQDGRWYA